MIEQCVEQEQRLFYIEDEWNCTEIQIKELMMDIGEIIPDSIIFGSTEFLGYKSYSPYCMAHYQILGDEVWAYYVDDCCIPKTLDKEKIVEWFAYVDIDLSERELRNIDRFFSNEVLEEAPEKKPSDGCSVDGILTNFYRLENGIIEKCIDSKTIDVSRLFVVCDDDDIFESVQKIFKKYKGVNNKINYDDEVDWLVWSILDNSDFKFSSVTSEIIQNFNGQIILVSDSFSIDWENGGCQEGVANAYFGSEEQYTEWSFDDGPKDNINLNISDLKKFIETYDMKLNSEEEAYIKSKYDKAFGY